MLSKFVLLITFPFITPLLISLFIITLFITVLFIIFPFTVRPPIIAGFPIPVIARVVSVIDIALWVGVTSVNVIVCDGL